METREANGYTIIELPAKVNTVFAPTLETKILDLLAVGVTRVACDFTNVDYISSAGLRVMLMATKKLQAAGGEFAILKIGAVPFEPFRLAGFDRIMTFKDSLD